MSIDPKDEHGVVLSEPHVKGIEQALTDARIGGFVSKICLESKSGSIYPDYEIVIPSANCSAKKLIEVVQEYLDKNGIDWHEPYAMPDQDGDFKFLLPFLSVQRNL